MKPLCDANKIPWMKSAVFWAAMMMSADTLAGDPSPRPDTVVVDLRTPHALEQLQQRDPGQFKRLQQVLRGLHDKPQRARSDWLQVTFNATNVDVSENLFEASFPPKQLLGFTLGRVRYIMNVTRSDLAASSMQLTDVEDSK